MKRHIAYLIILLAVIFLVVGCDTDDSIEVESIITSKFERQGAYFFDLEYELDGFEASLTAQEKVSQRVYEQYKVGDTYIFKRPAPTLSPSD